MTQGQTLKDVIRRLVLWSLVAEPMLGGDAAVPLHELRDLVRLAKSTLTSDELDELHDTAVEFNEDEHYPLDCELALQVVPSMGGLYRWVLWRETRQNGVFKRETAADVDYPSAGDAWDAGSVALVRRAASREPVMTNGA